MTPGSRWVDTGRRRAAGTAGAHLARTSARAAGRTRRWVRVPRIDRGPQPAMAWACRVEPIASTGRHRLLRRRRGGACP